MMAVRHHSFLPLGSVGRNAFRPMYAGANMGRPSCWFGLEFEPYSKFQIAHCSVGCLALDHTRVAAIDATSRIAGVHMVEQVEGIEPELGVQPLRNHTECLDGRGVCLLPSGTRQRVADIVAKGANLRPAPGPACVAIIEQRRCNLVPVRTRPIGDSRTSNSIRMATAYVVVGAALVVTGIEVLPAHQLRVAGDAPSSDREVN